MNSVTDLNIDSLCNGNSSENLSEYEKKRLNNLKRNFEVLKSAGIKPNIPQFLLPDEKNKKKCPVQKKHHTNQTKLLNEEIFKNVTFKLFGQSNKSKLTNENIPSDSELRKYVEMAKRPLHKKQRTKRKSNAFNMKGKNFIECMLKGAEAHLLKMSAYYSPSKTIDETSQEKIRENIRKPRYPKRNIQRKCYKEEDISSEDEFLHCDACEREYKGSCPIHGPMLWICDRKTSKNDPNKAVRTLPVFLSIGQSAIPKAGLGIWTEIPLPQGFVFGPYKGKITRNPREAQKSGYAWQVWKGQRPHHFVEGDDKRDSNWLRYVNCASREEQQNLVAFQYQQQVYYRTYKAILPFTELLVWYGNEYAGDMGIDTSEDKDIPPPRDIEGFECDVCGALFTSTSALEGHRRAHPHMQSDRRHRCHLCSYSSDHKGHFKEHLLTHSGEKPHRCTHCNKGFSRKKDFRRHIRIHTGETPFSCSKCGRTFNRLSSLLRHERTHTGERPFRCSTCGKDFNEAAHLKKHERVHTQQKPYRCTHCDYRSSYRTDLRCHIVFKHTRDFRHTCSLCGKGFIRPSELKKHVHMKHSDNERKDEEHS